MRRKGKEKNRNSKFFDTSRRKIRSASKTGFSGKGAYRKTYDKQGRADNLTAGRQPQTLGMDSYAYQQNTHHSVSGNRPLAQQQSTRFCKPPRSGGKGWERGAEESAWEDAEKGTGEGCYSPPKPALSNIERGYDKQRGGASTDVTTGQMLPTVAGACRRQNRITLLLENPYAGLYRFETLGRRLTGG